MPELGTTMAHEGNLLAQDLCFLWQLVGKICQIHYDEVYLTPSTNYGYNRRGIDNR